MYRKPSEVRDNEWAMAYQLWLNGMTLEQIGQKIGLRPRSGRSVSTYLNRYFGEGATNPIANSFIRSMRADYPGEQWTMLLDPCDNRGSGRFMSVEGERSSASKGVAKLTGNRSNEMKYRIEYQRSIAKSYDPWEQFEPKPLGLMSFSVWVGVLVGLLSPIINTEYANASS